VIVSVTGTSVALRAEITHSVASIWAEIAPAWIACGAGLAEEEAGYGAAAVDAADRIVYEKDLRPKSAAVAGA
jgi:hypothetical protein